MDELLYRLVDSYHDVANELSDIVETWDANAGGLPPEIDKVLRALRDTMDALYTETIPILHRATHETKPELPCDNCGYGVDAHVGVGMPCPSDHLGNYVHK